MAVPYVHAETAQELASFRNGASLRQTAVKLGLPSKRAPFLSDVLHGRTDNYSAEALDDLRRRLGLPPIPPTVPTAPCPTCGTVHGGGWDCQGAKVQLVRRKAKPKRIQDMSVAELTFAIENRKEIEL